MQVVAGGKMAVGQKSGGKHWTKDEVGKRQAAAQKLTRKGPVKLKMPIWLNDDARRIWKKTIKKMSEFDILDNVDADALAIYCDAVARYQECSLKIREEGYTTYSAQGTETVSAYVRSAQSYARIVMQYADKLGLNATARARLSKKIADGEPDPNAEMFGD